MSEESRKNLETEIKETMVEAYKAERKATFYRMLADSLHQKIAELEAKLKEE